MHNNIRTICMLVCTYVDDWSEQSGKNFFMEKTFPPIRISRGQMRQFPNLLKTTYATTTALVYYHAWRLRRCTPRHYYVLHTTMERNAFLKTFSYYGLHLRFHEILGSNFGFINISWNHSGMKVRMWYIYHIGSCRLSIFFRFTIFFQLGLNQVIPF